MRKQTTLLKKWTKVQNRHLTKKYTYGKSNIKVGLTSHLTKEWQIKATMRYYYTPFRMQKSKNNNKT